MNPIYRVAPLSLALALFGVGCDSGQALCDRACDCTGCNDDELDACYDQAEDLELDASQEGCSAEYNDLLACSHDNFECVDNRVEAEGCAGEYVELVECVAQDDD